MQSAESKGYCTASAAACLDQTAGTVRGARSSIGEVQITYSAWPHQSEILNLRTREGKDLAHDARVNGPLLDTLRLEICSRIRNRNLHPRNGTRLGAPAIRFTRKRSDVYSRIRGVR